MLLAKKSILTAGMQKIPGTLSRRQKKKARKLKKNSNEPCHEFTDSAKEIVVDRAPERKSYRQRIVDELGLKSLTEKSELRQSSEQNSKNQEGGPEVVVFYDAARKRKLQTNEKKVALKSSDIEEVKVSSSEQATEFDFKKARYEILKFGISGFEKTHKEEARIALAIKLGAKPPKKPHLNYKLLMEKRKEEKTKKKVERELNQKLGLNTKSKTKPLKTKFKQMSK